MATKNNSDSVPVDQTSEHIHNSTEIMSTAIQKDIQHIDNTVAQIVESLEHTVLSQQDVNSDVDKRKMGLDLVVSLVNDATVASSESKEIPYVTPLEDPLEKANKYLSKHDIFGLLQNITAGIAYGRPEEPLEFMIRQIEHLQEQDRHRKGIITRDSSTKTDDDITDNDKDGAITSVDKDTFVGDTNKTISVIETDKL